MTPKERRAKILEATQDKFMTLTDISRAAFGCADSSRYCRRLVQTMIQEGKMRRGEDIMLANHQMVATYSAVPDAEWRKPKSDFFHGRAPSVFDWRGNFNLRS